MKKYQLNYSLKEKLYGNICFNTGTEKFIINLNLSAIILKKKTFCEGNVCGEHLQVVYQSLKTICFNKVMSKRAWMFKYGIFLILF